MSIINDQADSEMNGLISDLQALIKQPSVSAKKQGLVECADLVASIMNKAGINAKVLYLYNDSKTKDNTGNNAANTPPPIVYGDIQGKS